MKSIYALLGAVFSTSLFAQTTELVLPQVQVSANKTEQEVAQSLFDVSVINHNQIGQKGFANVLDLLSGESGVQLSGVGGRGTAQEMYLRGTNPNQTLILLDGVPLNSLDLSGSPLRFLSTFDLSRVEVLKGNASALYGANAVGGVVHLVSDPIQKGFAAKGLMGYGTQNSRQLAAGLSGGNDVLRAKLSINNEATTGISAQRNAYGKDADKDAFYNRGVDAALSLMPTDSSELGVRFHHQKGQVHYDSGTFDVQNPNDFDDRAQFQNHIWQVYAQNEWNAIWQSTLRISGNEDKQKSFSQWNQSGDILDLKRNIFAFENQFKLPLGSLLALVEYQKEKGQFQSDSNINKPNNLAAALSWNADYNAHSWQLQARLDKHSAYKKNNTFHAAYAYSFLPNWRARLSYATAFRAPTLYELYAENASFLLFSNPHLKPEKSRNAEFSILWNKQNNAFSATFYQQRVRDLIAYVSDAKTFESSYQNVNRVRIKGASLAWNGHYNAWHTFLNYDYVFAQNEKTQKVLAKRAKHSAKLGADYTFSQFLLGSEWQLVGKRFNDHSQINKLAGFALWNVYGEYRFAKNVRVNLRVNNVLNQRYELALVGVDSKTGKRYAYNTAGLNAFLSVRVDY